MIVPVSKVRIIVSKDDQDKLVKALQQENKFMLFNYSDDVSLPSSENNTLRAIERGIEALSKYEKKKFFAYHEVKRSEFEQIEEDAQELLSAVNTNLEQSEQNSKRISDIEAELKLLSPYLNISVDTKALDELVKTRIVIGYVPLVNFEEFNRELTAKGHIFEESTRDAEFVYGAFGYEFVYENQALILLNAFRFVEVSLPRFKTKLSELLPTLTRELNELKAKIESNNNALKALSTDTYKLRAYYDYYYNKTVRSLVKFKNTERVAYIEGWVRTDEKEAFQTNLVNCLSFDFEELSVGDEEMVPTATKNNKVIQHFESITNMFSVPNPKELDPNPPMAVWYWIIFGIMMGDVGYGLAMLIFFLLFIKLTKPKGEMLSLVSIFVYSSIPAIIFGVLTGGFFGFDFDLGNIIGRIFGQTNWTSVVLDPVNDPVPMLILSLVIGVLHILTGLVLKVINEARRKDIGSLLADGMSWILILVGLGAAVIDMMILNTNILMWIGLGLIGVGVLLILLLAGRHTKNIFGKVTSGLGGLYGATGYLSDILSYSRILALSLSSAVIAFTMNLLAGMVIGVPVAGFIFATLILLIGHIFNFAMGLLSAYVHDGRLQYLEFFGKFYEGGGYKFSPFTYKLKYIDEIKENE